MSAQSDIQSLLPNSKNSGLSRTLVVNLAGIGIAATIAIALILAFFIHQSFTRLEDEQLRGHMGRVEAFLSDSRNVMDAKAKDWAIWDDTYSYTQNFNSAYEAANINFTSFANAQVDGLAISPFKGATTRAFFFDAESGEENPAMAEALRKLVTSPAFEKHARATSDYQTFANLNGEIYTVGTAQIRRSDGAGEATGYLVFASRLTGETVGEALQIKAQIDIAKPVAQAETTKGAGLIRAALPIVGSENQPIAAIRFSVPRRLIAAGNDLLVLVSIAVLTAIAAMLFLLHRRIGALVIAPVRRLQMHVAGIRERGEIHALAGPTRDDELGELQNEFNAMAEELQALRAKIEAQSFMLGKSQSSIGVMHNVRNCLSPVNVILGMLEQQMAEPLPPQADRALDELRDPATPPDRREKLAAFLSASHEKVRSDLTESRQSAREASRNLANALDAISDAQGDNAATDYKQQCDIAPLLGYSANVARFAEGLDIAVEITCDERVEVSGNRVLLSQVLENLFINAVEAIRATSRGHGRITASVQPSAETGECLVIIQDDGTGFDEQTAAHLFERGFSTRNGKSGGLGLHWCANTINAMGGSLSLASDGAGQGARASLRLNLARDEGQATESRDAA